MADNTKSIEFDIRGQICPSTLLITLREINAHRQELRRGELALNFLTDNRDATVTIPGAVRNMGYTVEVARVGGDYRIRVASNP